VNEFLVAYDLIYDNKRIYSEQNVTPGVTPVLSSSQNQVNLRDEVVLKDRSKVTVI
jgi:hypothetical protein